jgi:hypothetical protein
MQLDGQGEKKNQETARILIPPAPATERPPLTFAWRYLATTAADVKVYTEP